jgi:hypothetical protein
MALASGNTDIFELPEHKPLAAATVILVTILRWGQYI